jgi:hypothetical protein
MKMNLNINITLGGMVTVEKYNDYRKNDIKEGISCQSINYGPGKDGSNSSINNINFNGVTMNMEIQENVEDITPKEYIQAVGSAVKDIMSGVFQKATEEKKEDVITTDGMIIGDIHNKIHNEGYHVDIRNNQMVLVK